MKKDRRPLSIRYREAIRDCLTLDAGEKAVASTLCTYMKFHDLYCFPSISTIANGCSYSDGCVKVKIKSLAKKGWIIKMQRKVPSGRANSYLGVILEEGNTEVPRGSHPDVRSQGNRVTRQGNNKVPEKVSEDDTNRKRIKKEEKEGSEDEDAITLSNILRENPEIEQ